MAPGQRATRPGRSGDPVLGSVVPAPVLADRSGRSLRAPQGPPNPCSLEADCSLVWLSICYELHCRLGCPCSGVPASTASKWTMPLHQLARFLAPTRLVRRHNNGQNPRTVEATTHGAPRTPWGRHTHPTSSSCCNAMLRTSISHLAFLHEGWPA